MRISVRILDKEQWEPVLQVLFSLDDHKSPRNRVREFWSLEWQSHGESYVLNKDLIGDDETASRKSELSV